MIGSHVSHVLHLFDSYLDKINVLEMGWRCKRKVLWTASAAMPPWRGKAVNKMPVSEIQP